MYRIKCDDYNLYYPGRTDHILGSPTLKLEVNKAGSLSFIVYPTHEYFNNIKKMESIITVLQDSKIIFKGRVYSDLVNFYKVKKVECEGVLTYFNDSIVRVYEFTGTVSEYLEYLITQHNEQVTEAQRFKLGSVTVTDPNDYIIRANSNLPTTWAEIEEKLIKLLGGYIVVRYEDDGNYIDYLSDYTDTSTQDIKFSVNLLDLENDVKADKLATCIIPYGAKLSDIKKDETEDETTTGETSNDTRIDITSVNDGLDYIQNDDAVAKYGKIYEVKTWEDVTTPLNLLLKAQEYLSNTIRLVNKLTIKAIDLNLSDSEIEAFKLGDYIKVYSSPHGIAETMFLTSYSLDLSNPTGFTFTLGRENSSLLDSQIGVDRVTSNNVTRVDIIDKQVGELETEVETVTSETITYINQAIETSEENTRTLVKDYVKTSDFDTYKETVSTSFQQTADELQMTFNTIRDQITNENGEVNRQLVEILKYIRFVDGNIILGEVGNVLTTKIANGRISFLYNDTLEVAYISENKLYITQAEILESIIIGNFAFVPRESGNLSFRKVR